MSNPTSEFILKVTPHNSGSQHLVLGTETIPPGGVIPRHRHLGQDEILFLLTGSARVSLNDQDYEVHAGGKHLGEPEEHWSHTDPVDLHIRSAWIRRTMAALVRADERLKKEFPLITLPVLILHGTSDKNTNPSGSQHFYDRVGSVDKTLKLYEGSFHDLLNDIDKEAVIKDIQPWIDARLSIALEATAEAV